MVHHAVHGVKDARDVLVPLGVARPDSLGHLGFTGAERELYQPVRRVIVRGDVVQPLLVLERRGEIAFVLGQLGELLQQRSVAGFGRQEVLESLASGAEITGSGVRALA